MYISKNKPFYICKISNKNYKLAISTILVVLALMAVYVYL